MTVYAKVLSAAQRSSLFVLREVQLARPSCNGCSQPCCDSAGLLPWRCELALTGEIRAAWPNSGCCSALSFNLCWHLRDPEAEQLFAHYGGVAWLPELLPQHMHCQSFMLPAASTDA
jgi:hypothetical protein